MKENQQTDDFTVGAKVILHGQYGARSVRSIERMTETQISLHGYSGKFRRCAAKSHRHGQLIGNSAWDTCHITMPKPGEVEEVHKQERKGRLAIHLRAVDWNTHSLETLEAAWACLSEKVPLGERSA